MIKPSDIQARLRLFRYGLVVLVVVTFVVSLLAPFFALRGAGQAAPPITDFLGTAVIFTLVVAVIAIVLYFAYQYFLNRTPSGGGTAS
ncbi:MAG: hypothetical protein HZC41_13080 [Chloroflexi bacterium]|nr:hypothetical protein [Chloroflexota bacterium]